jgi:hypothetical protein
MLPLPATRLNASTATIEVAVAIHTADHPFDHHRWAFNGSTPALLSGVSHGY